MNDKKSFFPPWDSSITLEPGKSINMTEDVAMDYELQRKGLREIRGNVIARTIEIEFALDKLLTELFYQGIEGEKLKNNFHLIILEQSRITLSKKIDFLERYAKISGATLEFDNTIKNIKKVSETRNDFAHSWSIKEVTYQGQQIEKSFVKFREDMKSIWNQLFELYLVEEQKIDVDSFINKIKEFDKETKKMKGDLVSN